MECLDQCAVSFQQPLLKTIALPGQIQVRDHHAQIEFRRAVKTEFGINQT
jgi:hypothetical protein